MTHHLRAKQQQQQVSYRHHQLSPLLRRRMKVHLVLQQQQQHRLRKRLHQLHHYRIHIDHQIHTRYYINIGGCFF